ncbi:MAG: thymidine phosphorylase, partial [Sulfitobacter sp.]|nr:thymidine phosphorylase [Sulfitobacter sp.]
TLIRARVADGAAAEIFGRMVAALGGPADFTGRWRNLLPEAPVIQAVEAPRAGRVQSIDGEALGLAVVALGGGRRVESDRVDPAVGLSDVVRLGQSVTPGTPLAMIHAARADQAEAAAQAVRDAIHIGEEEVTIPPLVHERIG